MKNLIEQVMNGGQDEWTMGLLTLRLLQKCFHILLPQVILPMEFMLKQQLTLIMQGISATKFLKTWPELVSGYSFKRKNQGVTLASKSAVKINGKSIQVDPLLLFQRLSLAGKTDLVTALQHELSCYPLTLFKTAELLHEAQKD